MKQFISLSFVLFFSFLLSSCSSYKAKTKYRAQYDFTTIKSYSFFERNSAFTDMQNLSFSMRNRIELAIERGLDKKGYVYKTIAETDVIIGYYLISRSRKEFEAYNKGVKYCAYCLVSLDSGKTSGRRDTPSLEPGNLIVDVISAETKRSIWRSYYPLKIKDDDNSTEVQEKLHEAVNAMLANVPHLNKGK